MTGANKSCSWMGLIRCGLSFIANGVLYIFMRYKYIWRFHNLKVIAYGSDLRCFEIERHPRMSKLIPYGS
jgi:hypothetical protein